MGEKKGSESFDVLVDVAALLPVAEIVENRALLAGMIARPYRWDRYATKTRMASDSQKSIFLHWVHRTLDSQRRNGARPRLCEQAEG